VPVLLGAGSLDVAGARRPFDGLKPIEVIERGEVDRIWQMIVYLRSGVAS
jgi:hypothetical protein